MPQKPKIKWLLSQPEGQFIEFKTAISASLSKELAAFANSGGGAILLGVDDKGAVKGITNPNRQISVIESYARNLDPALPVKVKLHKIEDKEILLIEIPDGKDKPYSCSEGFYLRSGASTQKMKRDEIIEFLYASGRVKFEQKICSQFTYPGDFDEQAYRYFVD